MQGLKQRGWVLRFLRAARKRRPDNGPLIAAIRQLCPDAMQEEPPASGPVGVLVDVLELMRARLADPQIASAVGGSRAELGSLAGRLARLRVYKSLHDVLQKCQVSQFSLLADTIRRLRNDPLSNEPLRDLLIDLRMTFTKARQGLRPLEASLDDAEERTWIDGIVAAVAEIERARVRLDDRAARLAAYRIRDQLRNQPSRINGLLRAEARKLPLKRLSDAIASASDAAGLSPEQRAALKGGVDSVADLRQRLERRVADHNRWQLVEEQLWLIDNVVERDGSSTEEFQDYWEIVKDSLQPLWGADVGAEWAVATQGHGAAIDAALATTPPQAPQAKRSYGELRSEALWQFFSVDGDLSELCENVLQLGSPVVALLEG